MSISALTIEVRGTINKAFRAQAQPFLDTLKRIADEDHLMDFRFDADKGRFYFFSGFLNVEDPEDCAAITDALAGLGPCLAEAKVVRCKDDNGDDRSYAIGPDEASCFMAMAKDHIDAGAFRTSSAANGLILGGLKGSRLYGQADVATGLLRGEDRNVIVATRESNSDTVGVFTCQEALDAHILDMCNGDQAAADEILADIYTQDTRIAA